MDPAGADAQRRDLLLDHGHRPHHQGLREPFDAEVTHVNPTCGDQVQLRVALEGDRIVDVSYDALGCTLSLASTSILTDLVIGASVAEALALKERVAAVVRGSAPAPTEVELLGDAVALAGVGRHPLRVTCALLGWTAFTDAAVRAVAARTRDGG